VKKRVKDLVEGDVYDAWPLCEGCLEPFGDNVDDDAAWVAAECGYFEVERVEQASNGDYVIWGHPFNMEATGDEMVEVDKR